MNKQNSRELNSFLFDWKQVGQFDDLVEHKYCNYLSLFMVALKKNPQSVVWTTKMYFLRVLEAKIKTGTGLVFPDISLWFAGGLLDSFFAIHVDHLCLFAFLDNVRRGRKRECIPVYCVTPQMPTNTRIGMWIQASYWMARRTQLLKLSLAATKNMH